MFPIFNDNHFRRTHALLAALALSLSIGLVGCVDVIISDRDDEASDDGSNDGAGDNGDATSGEITLSWERPTARENGSDFMASEVDYYEVAYGSEPGEYAQTFDTIDESAKINSLDAGETYYFSVRVHDSGGMTSEYATEVSTTIN